MFDPYDRDFFPAPTQPKGTEMKQQSEISKLLQDPAYLAEQEEKRKQFFAMIPEVQSTARNPMISRTFESAYGKQTKEEK
jgi:hypothetical protein